MSSLHQCSDNIIYYYKIYLIRFAEFKINLKLQLGNIIIFPLPSMKPHQIYLLYNVQIQIVNIHFCSIKNRLTTDHLLKYFSYNIL